MAEVIVVGSGIAGLAAAFEASRHGHIVTILEKSKLVGGRGTSRKIGDAPLNAGPHLLKWGGPLHKFISKASKVPIRGKRLKASSFHHRDNNSWNYLALDAQAIKSRGLPLESRLDLMRLRRVMKKAAKNHPKMPYEDWVITLPEFIQLELSLWAMLSSWSKIENCGVLQYHSECALSSLWNRGLFEVEHGWADLVGRLLALLDRQGVDIHSNAKVERLNIVDEKVLGVVLEGGIKYESHNVILALPAESAKKIIEKSNLQTHAFEGLNQQIATVLDLWLTGTFLPSGLAVDLNKQIISLTKHREKDSQISVMFLHPPGRVSDEMIGVAEEKIDSFLNECALGWTDYIIKIRLSKRITISSSILSDSRPNINHYSDLGLLLAGDYLQSDYYLADCSADTGLRAGSMLGKSQK